jgi:hypothetical protein
MFVQLDFCFVITAPSSFISRLKRRPCEVKPCGEFPSTEMTVCTGRYCLSVCFCTVLGRRRGADTQKVSRVKPKSVDTWVTIPSLWHCGTELAGHFKLFEKRQFRTQSKKSDNSSHPV